MLIVAGILFSFGSCGAAYYTRTSRAAHFAPWMYFPPLSFIANVGGFVFGFAAIYLLVTSLGWVYGLGAWAISCIVSTTIIAATINQIFPLMFILSMLSMVAGTVIWVVA